jgi:hypothetical protein
MRRLALAALALVPVLTGCVGVRPEVPEPAKERPPTPWFPPGPWKVDVDLGGLGTLLLLLLAAAAVLAALVVGAFAGTGPWNRAAAGGLVALGGLFALGAALVPAVVFGAAGAFALARRPSGAS